MVLGMSLFGEIVHPTSRAVDDDEDEDDCPEPPMRLEWEGNKEALERCDTLLLGDGRLSCALVQHCLETETERETLKCVSAEGNGRKICHTKVYAAPPVCIALCDGRLPSSQHKEYIIQLLAGVKKMVALTSKCLVDYRPAESEDIAAGPFLRGLATRHCTDGIQTAYLPPPNVISGVCAAAMEMCEVAGVAAELYVCYTDTPLDASIDSDVGRCLYSALQSSLLSGVKTVQFPSTGKFDQEKGAGPVLSSNMYS